jgi:hypothetical protein
LTFAQAAWVQRNCNSPALTLPGSNRIECETVHRRALNTAALLAGAGIGVARIVLDRRAQRGRDELERGERRLTQAGDPARFPGTVNRTSAHITYWP